MCVCFAISCSRSSVNSLILTTRSCGSVCVKWSRDTPILILSKHTVNQNLLKSWTLVLSHSLVCLLVRSIRPLIRLLARSTAAICLLARSLTHGTVEYLCPVLECSESMWSNWKQAFSRIFGKWTDGRADGGTDRQKEGQMDGQTDGWPNRPSYRDAKTHLKMSCLQFTP